MGLLGHTSREPLGSASWWATLLATLGSSEAVDVRHVVARRCLTGRALPGALVTRHPSSRVKTVQEPPVVPAGWHLEETPGRLAIAGRSMSGTTPGPQVSVEGRKVLLRPQGAAGVPSDPDSARWAA